MSSCRCLRINDVGSLNASDIAPEYDDFNDGVDDSDNDDIFDDTFDRTSGVAFEYVDASDNDGAFDDIFDDTFDGAFNKLVIPTWLFSGVLKILKFGGGATG